MAGAEFLHGVEVIEIDDGPRPIRTVRSSIIGIVGTAPDADSEAFPLDTPVLIAGSRLDASKLDTVGDGLGTLPHAVDLILDQIGAAIVVVRVNEETDFADTLTNVIGGTDGEGGYLGMHALLGAQSALGVQPRILIAPGFTGDRPKGVTAVSVGTQGSGYATAPTVTFSAPPDGGSAATGHAVLGTAGNAGKVVSVIVDTAGYGYVTAPTVSFSGGGGSGAVATATVAAHANPVVAEMIGIAERLRAVIIADGPNTTDAAVIAYADDWGSKRVYVVDPNVKVLRATNIVNEPASSAVAGLIAKIDNDRGFWWSPSNQNINGIIGTGRSIDFAMGDPNSRANFLNELANVATIIREDGYRLWGNRTLSSDAKFAFLNVVRTADIINDSIMRAHLWAVDRNITKTYLEDVTDSVNAYLRQLVGLGAILGGKCWPDPDLNSPESIADGKVWFNIDFTPPYPAEHVIFRSRITNDYLEDLVL